MKKSFIDTIFCSYHDILFDLDNTLYDEKFYLFRAYEQIGFLLENSYQIAAIEVERYLVDNFMKNGRDNLFDLCIKHFMLPNEAIIIMLDTLRTVSFDHPIQLKEYVMPFLCKSFELGKRVFVITNGNVIQQQNKVRNIDWKNMHNLINFIYANSISPKPARNVYDKIKVDYQIQTPVYIGDSEVDTKFAENCCIPFIHVDKFEG